MPCTAQSIIDKALSQVGYKEGSGNNNKYGIAYGYNKVSWCCIFIWWLFNQCGASDLFYGGKKTASCTTLYNWAKKNSQTVTPANLRAGDIVFFDWDSSGDADHVGVCVSRSGNTVYTVEGNTSTGNSADNIMVYWGISARKNTVYPNSITMPLPVSSPNNTAS